MKLKLYRGFDIDLLREANPHFTFRVFEDWILMEAKWPCPICKEPMLDGSYCGAYCINPSCVGIALKQMIKVKIRKHKGTKRKTAP